MEELEIRKSPAGLIAERAKETLDFGIGLAESIMKG